MNSIESGNNLQREAAQSKERLQLAIPAITLSGPSGTGKTSAAEILRQIILDTTETNIKFIKVGEIFRKRLNEISGQEMLTYAQRDLDVDQWIDNLQVEELNKASLENPLLLEGRLAGIIAKEQKSKTPDLSVVSILFTAHPSTRYLRVLRREKEIHPDLTFDDVRRLTAEREKGDLSRWRTMHPQLRNVNPFGPKNRDTSGNPTYDLVVDTNRLTVRDVADNIINYLTENGHLRKSASLPEKGQIFPINYL